MTARDVAVIVAAGGVGSRLGGGTPKALRELRGEPLLRHAFRGVLGAQCVAGIVVVAPPDAEDTVRDLSAGTFPREGPQWRVVPGGADRRRSVAAGVAALPAGPGIVLVHDAARALTPPSLMARVAAAVRSGHRAVVPVLPVTDTIAEVDSAGSVVGGPDRSALRAVQTPQGFCRDTLVAAHATPPAGAVTDDAGMVARLGVPVHTVPGSPYAMKITTPYDLTVAEALLGYVPEQVV